MTEWLKIKTMKIHIYRLTFTTPLHLSDVRADYGNSERRVHSDTLYAAIMQAWAILGKSDWITKEPSFTLSSLFPFTTSGNNTVYFFPKPFTLPVDTKTDYEPDFSKKIKKIQYFDKSYFEEFLLGNYRPSKNDIKEDFLTKERIDENFIESQVVPRIRWNRKETEDSEPFYMEKLYFKEKSGLWFAFIGKNTEQERFEAGLKYLCDAGIGTDRNIGNGRFTYVGDELILGFPSNANYCMNLSLYCPKDIDELKPMLSNTNGSNKILNEKIGYDFICRGGWISEPFNTYRKRFIHMFKEGSVFKKQISDIQIMGITHDLTPDIIKNKHNIFRCGKAIFLPVKFD